MFSSCKEVAPGAGLEYGRDLRKCTSTFLHHRLVSQSDRRKPSSIFLAGCKIKLGKELCSSWRYASREVLAQGVSDLQPVDEYECEELLNTVGDF